MTVSSKDIDKKLNTSAEAGGLFPSDLDKTAGDALKPENLLAELDSKLDDLFRLDDTEAKDPEKRPTPQAPPADVKEAPAIRKGIPPEKDKARTSKAGAPIPPAVLKKKIDDSPILRTASPKVGDSGTAKAPKLAAVAATTPTPVLGDSPAAVPSAAPEEETKKPDKAAAPAGKVSDRKDIRAQVEAKPDKIRKEAPRRQPGKGLTPRLEKKQFPAVENRPAAENLQAKKKESKVTGQKQDPKKYKILILGLGVIALAGAISAIFIFLQGPDPSNLRQPVTAPVVHKIKRPPAKLPEPKIDQIAPLTLPLERADAQPQPNPLAVVLPDDKKLLPQVVKETDVKNEIKNFLLEWKKAWEKSAGRAGSIDRFISFYADDFTSNDLDKKSWGLDKAEKNRRKEWIRIELDKLEIAGPGGDGRYEASFSQIYQSSNYAETSEQTLILKKEASGWKITGVKLPPAPPPPSISYPYSIQEGSYRNLSSARQALEAYRQKGLQAYLTPVELGEKGVWYRLFIGCYTNPESAAMVIKAKELKDVNTRETRYAHLIGTYASTESLQSQSLILTKNGYFPYVVGDDQKNLKLYVGAYYTLKDAEKLSGKLSAIGIPARVVER